MQSDSSSIHELLQLFRQLKVGTSDLKLKDISNLSFSSKNYQSTNRNAFDSISFDNINNINNGINKSQTTPFSKNNQSVFEKLHQQKKQLQMKKCRLQYETRRSKQEKERHECTFSPNIKSRFKIKTEYDSIENNDSVYLKNMQWLERKERGIKQLQCEKNQENTGQFTFTPRINKQKKKQVGQPKVINKKGVSDYLNRLEKAKQNEQYIKDRKKNPYSHVWNIKRGHFSYVK